MSFTSVDNRSLRCECNQVINSSRKTLFLNWNSIYGQQVFAYKIQLDKEEGRLSLLICVYACTVLERKKKGEPTSPAILCLWERWIWIWENSFGPCRPCRRRYRYERCVGGVSFSHCLACSNKPEAFRMQRIRGEGSRYRLQSPVGARTLRRDSKEAKTKRGATGFFGPTRL